MNRQGATIQAIGGHLLDLYRLVRFDPRAPHSYSKFRQIKLLGRRCGARLLIETGTFLGNTAMRASRVFERVITIELDPELHRTAAAYLSRRTNVECVLGDATKVLSEIIARPDVTDALVFLDGHFSGVGTAAGDEPVPACHELNLLGQYRQKIAGIVIDDFRLFGVESGWPRKSQLMAALEANFSDGFQMTVHLDQALVWRTSRSGAGMVLRHLAG